ncbi:related to Probable tubulin--tyrosine ligase PBY1 [Hanseniaspora guilliermondii]|uniref:Related to Probable tubulin--tyrosine ligase PBY1 n=1 Tax=Hanseniaspora guilliermondii TaxID=56406 RepID=A0A1L0CZV2_9ASCO|nr:related to Probable tubulin--tyrosine ligase PBY1 [Hanseniaspora guilliermondii]
MTIVITNDDGPLDSVHSQYISPFINHYLSNYSPNSTYYSEKLLLSVPSEQKSWISKAHFASKDVTIKFLYSSSQTPYDNENKIGPFSKPLPINLHQGLKRTKFSPYDDDEYQEIFESNNPHHLNSSQFKQYYDIEWILVSGTPATATDIGIHHLVENSDVTKLVSGPNVGRNVSRPYITSSGTIGATMESYITSGGKINGIGLSWAYFDNMKNVNKAGLDSTSMWSWKVIFQLNKNTINAECFSVNVPILNDGLNNDTRVVLAPIQDNTWKSLYEGQHDSTSDYITFKWNPDFDYNRRNMIKGMNENQQNDGSLIEGKNITITPLLASFAVKLNEDEYGNEIQLANDIKQLHIKEQNCKAAVILNNEVPYVNDLWATLLSEYNKKVDIYRSLNELEDSGKNYENVFHIAEYEELLHSKSLANTQNYYQNSFTFRKSLIRKHYLLKTIQYYIAKHPNSILKTNFPESFHLDLDYAEFLDEALDDNWDLRQELEASVDTPQWWIMKPSMSDKGQGIRLFKTIDQLQSIFDYFDEDEDGEGYNGIIINQLRHFIIQKLLMNPLIIDNRKFHIRCYVVCVGDLQVYVYDRMLCLFSQAKYVAPSGNEIDLNNPEFLSQHLTNTCQQSSISTKTVRELNQVFNESQGNMITSGIHRIVKDLFEAAKQDNYNFQPLENAYEIYGLDFLVDEDYQPHLLEVNAYPDFKQTGDDLSGLINELFNDVLHLSVLPNLINEGGLRESSNLKKVLEIQQEKKNW